MAPRPKMAIEAGSGTAAGGFIAIVNDPEKDVPAWLIVIVKIAGVA